MQITFGDLEGTKGKVIEKTTKLVKMRCLDGPLKGLVVH